jgi:hypothetical protein
MFILSHAKFLEQKHGSEISECEDAFSVDEGRHLFCVADGATEAFASGDWAHLLVDRWTSSEALITTPDEFIAWAGLVGLDFEAIWKRKDLPWYAQEKLASGSYAAFAGLVFFECNGEWFWRATAIGDSCLILWRKGQIEESMPLSDPAAFGFRPTLLPSNKSKQQMLISEIKFRSAPVQPGDSFYLLTDAIAAWFLRAAKSSPKEMLSFESMLQGNEQEALSTFVKEARGDGALRNDDVGIVYVRISG